MTGLVSSHATLPSATVSTLYTWCKLNCKQCCTRTQVKYCGPQQNLVQCAYICMYSPQLRTQRHCAQLCSLHISRPSLCITTTYQHTVVYTSIGTPPDSVPSLALLPIRYSTALTCSINFLAWHLLCVWVNRMTGLALKKVTSQCC